MDEFLVTGRLYFIAEPGGDSPKEVTAKIVNMQATLGGRTGTIVIAFTDADLAARHIEQRAYMTGYLTLSWPTAELPGVLAELATLGETHLVIDPEAGPNRGRIFPIPTVIDAILNNRR